ncbi:MAG: hypothetical protein ACTSR3_17355 [Candidatus Helarchaeota archaeon]
MRKLLIIFGIEHWGLFGFLVYYFLFELEISWVWVLIGILIYVIFFVLVIVRVLRHFYHFPIPSFITNFIDNPIRRKFIQNPDVLAERMQLKTGMVVVEIGPGKGFRTVLKILEKFGHFDL